MLALLGLLGLAVVGTAFVGTFPEQEASDDAMPPLSEGEVEPPVDTQAETQETHAQDLLDLIETDQSQTGDVIIGTESDDDLTGTEGADYINGGAGDDSATGDTGDDQMYGDDGDDHLSGDDGDDLLHGDMADDTLLGGTGDDTLHGGSGADLMIGGDGNDQLAGGYDDDELIGGEGEDNLQGSDGNDVLDGVTGESIATRDYLNGSEGNDHLIGNNGDVMSGGEDADRFEISSGTVSIMDYTDEDLLVLNYQGVEPVLTTETTANGITLLADGEPVASLFGLTSFDISNVQLVAN